MLCAAATVGGNELQEIAGNELQGGINGFAAGALLVMLVWSMIPEASEKAKDQAGLAAVLGFAVAAGCWENANCGVLAAVSAAQNSTIR